MCAQDDAWWPCALIQALATIDALEAENKRLGEALKLYAYPHDWIALHPESDIDRVPDFYGELDFGATAQIALEGRDD